MQFWQRLEKEVGFTTTRVEEDVYKQHRAPMNILRERSEMDGDETLPFWHRLHLFLVHCASNLVVSFPDSPEWSCRD